MATFQYEALDGSGRSKRGVISADNPKEARQTLRRQNLMPVRIDNARKRSLSRTGKAGEDGNRRGHLKARELVMVTRQLATLVSTAVPLEESLSAVAQQADNERVRLLILSVRERILEGWRLADAFAEDPKSFPPLYRSVVSAGELSGDLGAVLERLATMLEKNRAIRSKALTALIYPAALAVVAFGVVIALMRFVVPKIVEQFQDFDTRLPVITEIVIAISNFLADFGIVLLVALGAGIAGFWRLMKMPGFRRPFDRSVLRLPVAGKLVRGMEGARFGRTLATLFAGGTPLIDALVGAQKTVGNLYIREQLETTITAVREGSALATGLKKAGVLPPMMTHMVAAGEKSGELPRLLDKAADQLEEEFETATTVALRLVEPLIIVFMGLVVMVIVLSILLPTLRLNTLASGG